eukprot:2847115-Pyramimonas_sp.AAC.1
MRTPRKRDLERTTPPGGATTGLHGAGSPHTAHRRRRPQNLNQPWPAASLARVASNKSWERMKREPF